MRFGNAIAPLAALALMGCGGGEALRTSAIDPRVLRSLASVHVDAAAAAAMLNAYRASRGLGPVRLDPALNAMAQRQADAMVAANALSHDVGGSFASRLASAGVDATEAGENVGGGYYSTEEALAGWRGSPEHDANLLIARATRFGIAVAKDARTQYRVYWAMEVAAEPQRPAGGLASLVGGQ
ncbi:MAG TPA: CAP domain-containing protein [Roseiarcus sp.]|nr:CAP domain-containing protein [Roseiarcus sp.]